LSEGSRELSLILTLDALGERYGMLPSEVISRSNTLDIYVMDAAISYRNHLQDKANGKVGNGGEDLAELMAKVKSQAGAQ
jgi:hypothetical protein